MNCIRKIRLVSAVLLTAVALPAATPATDSTRGAQVFADVSCSQCHRIGGNAAAAEKTIGPDLGRIIDRGFTPSLLASTMWNHAPTMWAAMDARKIAVKPMDDQAAADLFAFFYSKRFFENPGDAGRGKQLFTSRSCSACHGLTETKISGVQLVSHWTSLNDPIGMIEQMWNHASTMHDLMAVKNIKWPRLSGQDVADLIVYLRNIPANPPEPGVFRTASPASGEKLFETKGCLGCHTSPETFLSAGLAGQTLTDVAADMWNHGIAMSSAGVRFQPGEMRDVASFIWTRRLLDNGGDAVRGKKVFAARNCSTCHDDASSGAPALAGTKDFTGISIIAALWRHGPSMLSLMQQKHLAWPRFSEKEMSDVIAYLNTREAGSAKR